MKSPVRIYCLIAMSAICLFAQMASTSPLTQPVKAEPGKFTPRPHPGGAIASR